MFETAWHDDLNHTFSKDLGRAYDQHDCTQDRDREIGRRAEAVVGWHPKS